MTAPRTILSPAARLRAQVAALEGLLVRIIARVDEMMYCPFCDEWIQQDGPTDHALNCEYRLAESALADDAEIVPDSS